MGNAKTGESYEHFSGGCTYEQKDMLSYLYEQRKKILYLKNVKITTWETHNKKNLSRKVRISTWYFHRQHPPSEMITLTEKKITG